MDGKIEQMVYGGVIFLSILAVVYLVNSSGILATNFITLTDLDSWLGFLFKTENLLLILIFPIPFAIISLLSHFKEKREVYIISFGGAIPALLISLAIFGFGTEKILLKVLFIVAIFAIIQLCFIKKDELKSYVTFRTASESSKTAFLIIGVGIFLTAAMIGIANNEANTEMFGEKVMELSFNQQSGGQELTTLLADSFLKSQQQTVDAIILSPQYQKLTTKTDPDVQEFVVMMNGVQEDVHSPLTRQKVIDEMKKAQGSGAAGQPLTFDFLRRQSPMIGLIADYYWLLNALSLATLFTFVANLLLSNIAGAYAATLRKFMESFTGETKIAQ